jgi:hypothetical protein
MSYGTLCCELGCLTQQAGRCNQNVLLTTAPLSCLSLYFNRDMQIMSNIEEVLSASLET